MTINQSQEITSTNFGSEAPVLVVMAAGMGSRYGGNKQIDTMTTAGEIIMDFSLYDAYEAGFREAIIIIRKEIEDEIKAHLEKGAKKKLNISLAYQDKEDVLGLDIKTLASKEALDEINERTKPWGTGHAVLSARSLVKGPFAVINADDFYGRSAFQAMFDFLSSGEGSHHYAMVSYRLDKTLSETGYVSRGVCSVSDDGLLTGITERTRIERRPDGVIAYSEDDGETWTALPEDTPVSMNFWGFSHDMMDELENGFRDALKDILATNPLKGEYYLPGAVDKLLKAGLTDARVLISRDKWYGVTNKADKALVSKSLENMKKEGTYPDALWD